MKFSNFLAILAALGSPPTLAQQEDESAMVKMCLFYPNASGHARSDPILNQSCPSDHVHTFYGPQNFHPNTTYEQLRDTNPKFSSSPWQENQSLYWHPSIYEVAESNGQTTYTRVSQLETSPYYRWDTTTPPETVAFPPDFRMIAYSNQEGANGGGENGQNLFVECCNIVNGEEDCENFVGHPLVFPSRNCDFLGLAFAMPTCWDESKGVGINDPIGHVAYTTDGTVSGPCPVGYDKRIPQVQLFVRIGFYRGAQYRYQLSDGSDAFHVDFMNGWQEGKLQEIIQGCQPSGALGYNPPCDCTQFLTATSQPSGAVCDEDVKQYILNEETAVLTTNLPHGTCQGTDLIEKSWGVDPPFQCSTGGPTDDDGTGPVEDDTPVEDDVLVGDDQSSEDDQPTADDEPGEDDELTTDDEPLEDDKPVEDDEPMEDDEPLEDDEPIGDDEPLEDDEPVDDDEPIEDDKLNGDDETVEDDDEEGFDDADDDEPLEDDEFFRARRSLRGGHRGK